MSYQAEVFNVMLSAPSDVKKELDIIKEVVHEWNSIHSETQEIVLLPRHWSTDVAPSAGASPQEIINRKMVDSSDLLVAVFQGKFGTPTDDYQSGTEEEIRLHIQADKPTMVYFWDHATTSVEIDPEQKAKIAVFKQLYREIAIYGTYTSLRDFRNTFNRDLQLTMKNELASSRIPRVSGSGSRRLVGTRISKVGISHQQPTAQVTDAAALQNQLEIFPELIAIQSADAAAELHRQVEMTSEKIAARIADAASKLHSQFALQPARPPTLTRSKQEPKLAQPQQVQAPVGDGFAAPSRARNRRAAAPTRRGRTALARLTAQSRATTISGGRTMTDMIEFGDERVLSFEEAGLNPETRNILDQKRAFDEIIAEHSSFINDFKYYNERGEILEKSEMQRIASTPAKRRCCVLLECGKWLFAYGRKPKADALISAARDYARRRYSQSS